MIIIMSPKATQEQAEEVIEVLEKNTYKCKLTLVSIVLF